MAEFMHQKRYGLSSEAHCSQHEHIGRSRLSRHSLRSIEPTNPPLVVDAVVEPGILRLVGTAIGQVRHQPTQVAVAHPVASHRRKALVFGPSELSTPRHRTSSPIQPDWRGRPNNRAHQCLGALSCMRHVARCPGPAALMSCLEFLRALASATGLAHSPNSISLTAGWTS